MRWLLGAKVSYFPEDHGEDEADLVGKEDTKILLNDWPYGNEKGICKSPGYQFLILLSGVQKSDCKIDHIVVWTKASIETCPPLGDLTPASRQLIQDYVSRTFSALVG